MSQPAATDLALRPVTDHDRDFLVELYGSTRAEELSQVVWPEGQQEAFIWMQFDAQDVDYRRQNPDASFEVIEVDGRPAGRLYVDRRPGDIRIVDISLIEEFRGHGLGSRMITALMQEAESSGRILSIHVEIHNRAAHLYERLGFVVVAEHGLYRRMEWGAS